MPGITFDPQLDGDRTEAWDCGVESLAMALDAMSGGSVHPDSATIRRWMGGDKDTTNPWDWARACRSSQARRAFRRRGLTPPKVAIADGLDLDRLRRLLFDRGRLVVLAIDYGTVARREPRVWSSDTYRGNHAVLARRGLAIDGEPDEVKVLDPLADGRRVGGRQVPHGPRRWRWSTVRRAAGSVKDQGRLIYPKRDRWLGLICWASEPIEAAAPPTPPVPPEPDPDEDSAEPPEDQDVIARLYDAVDRLEVAQALIAEGLATLRAVLPPDSESRAEPGLGLDLRRE